VRILIADDHLLVREGFKTLLERVDGVNEVLEASNGNSAVQLSKERKPEVVILDVLMPELSGISAASAILADLPETSLIALSANFSPEAMDEFLELGGRGILLKTCSFDELKLAIETVSQGAVYISPQAKDMIRRKNAPVNTVSKKLSAREQEILRQIAEGSSLSQIATNLGLSIKTVETYKRRMMAKLELYTVAELTKYALKRGITALSAK
jgi:DNA-binding NarL/FixJ family response regulator